MRRAWVLAAWVALLALAGVAVAQQGANVNPAPGSLWTYFGATLGAGWAPLSSLTLPVVNANADLRGLRADVPGVCIVRKGYATPGDGGTALYCTKPSSTCVDDGGSCLQPASGSGRWEAVFEPTGADVRVWGAVGDGGTTDNGPAIRAACAYGARSGTIILLPVGTFVIKTLDPSGLGALVMGTGAAGAPAPVCDITGVSSRNHPDASLGATASVLSLGNGLNRPLVYVRTNTLNPTLTRLTLTGNRGGQTGWAGGPNGKLFAIQVEDFPSVTYESSIRMFEVVVRDGYNGNLYIGSGRGATLLRDAWLQYSGQTTADYALFLNGYDGVFNNLAIGSNAGSGVLMNEGSQYQFNGGGAIFYNEADGMVVNGNKVQYITVSDMNIQANGSYGIKVLNSPPFAGSASFGHFYSNLTFDGNSAIANNTYSDVYIDDGNLYERFTNIAFGGKVSSGVPHFGIPKYSIELVGSGAAIVDNVSFGSGTPFLTGFTNNLGRVAGNVQIPRRWTPVLTGSTLTGTFTGTTAEGSWGWHGNHIYEEFTIVGTLSGATGFLKIAGSVLPVSATPSSRQGQCAINRWDGWTGGGGGTAFTVLGGHIGSGATEIVVTKSGPNQISVDVPVSEFSGSITLTGSCVYGTTQFP